MTHCFQLDRQRVPLLIFVGALPGVEDAIFSSHFITCVCEGSLSSVRIIIKINH